MAFEFDGEKYKKASAHQKEWGKRIISEFSFRGDERILDLGSGDGALTSMFAELVPDGFVLGIDASRGMIEEAGKIGKPNLLFREMDINSIEFREEFDLVFSNATLHWIKDHRSLLTRVIDSLKPGGIVRFNFAAAGNCSNFFRIVRELIAGDYYIRYFKDFEWPWYMPEIEEYRAMAEQFSFREARVWGENADRYFPDTDALVGWIDQPSIVPFLKHINDAETGELFRDAVVKRMIKATLQEDGTFFETFRRVNLFARK